MKQLESEKKRRDDTNTSFIMKYSYPMQPRHTSYGGGYRGGRGGYRVGNSGQFRGGRGGHGRGREGNQHRRGRGGYEGGGYENIQSFNQLIGAWVTENRHKLKMEYQSQLNKVCGVFNMRNNKCKFEHQPSCQWRGKTRQHTCVCGAKTHKMYDCKKIWA